MFRSFIELHLVKKLYIISTFKYKKIKLFLTILNIRFKVLYWIISWGKELKPLMKLLTVEFILTLNIKVWRAFLSCSVGNLRIGWLKLMVTIKNTNNWDLDKENNGQYQISLFVRSVHSNNFENWDLLSNNKIKGFFLQTINIFQPVVEFSFYFQLFCRQADTPS